MPALRGGSRNDPRRNRCGCFLPDPDQVGDDHVRPTSGGAYGASDGAVSTPRASLRARTGCGRRRPSSASSSTIWHDSRLVRRRSAARSSMILLVLGCGGQGGRILRRDDDVAGRTGHLALARAFERLAGGLRDVEQAIAVRLAIDAPFLAVGADEGNRDHRCTTLAALAAARIASSRSAKFVSRRVAARSPAGSSCAPVVRSGPIARSTWLGRPDPLAQADARRKGDVAQVGHQPRDVHALAAQVEIAVVALLGRPLIVQPANSSTRDVRTARATCAASASIRSRASSAAAPKPAHKRGRERARAQPAFLPAAVEQRRQIDAVADPQRADALRPVDLVRRDRDQVQASGIAIRP